MQTGGNESHLGIWSIVWSPAGAEVAAGTSHPGVVLYDVATERPRCVTHCHRDDVNGVAFMDPSGDVLVTGSDDTLLFVHDRCAPPFARARCLYNTQMS
jgi:WD40 repeat protein